MTHMTVSAVSLDPALPVSKPSSYHPAASFVRALACSVGVAVKRELDPTP